MQLSFSIHKEGSGTAAITPSSPPHRAAGSGNKETIDSPDVCVRRTGWRGGSVLEANTASAAQFDSDLKPQAQDACTGRPEEWSRSKPGGGFDGWGINKRRPLPLPQSISAIRFALNHHAHIIISNKPNLASKIDLRLTLRCLACSCLFLFELPPYSDSASAR